MSEPEWEAKLKAFFKKTGEDFKRAGNDIRSEARRLMTEVKDPHVQAKMRETLNDVGEWAKKTTDELAVLVDQGVQKAEVAFAKATDRVRDLAAAEPKPTAPDHAPSRAPSAGGAAPSSAAASAAGSSAASTSAPGSTRRAGPRASVKKTVGPAPRGSRKSPAARRATAPGKPARKTVGKKGPSSSGQR